MADDVAAVEALAKRFFDRIEAGDLQGVADCYAEDAVIWHNTDRAEQGKAANVEVLKGFTGRFSGIRYADRRLSVWPGGFAHQHLLRARRADGGEVELPAALICRVDGGKITRLDEYFDSAHLTAWFA
jgi:ketosteroid isomerase-like protein